MGFVQDEVYAQLWQRLLPYARQVQSGNASDGTYHARLLGEQLLLQENMASAQQKRLTQELAAARGSEQAVRQELERMQRAFSKLAENEALVAKLSSDLRASSTDIDMLEAELARMEEEAHGSVLSLTGLMPVVGKLGRCLNQARLWVERRASPTDLPLRDSAWCLGQSRPIYTRNFYLFCFFARSR